MDFNQWKNKIGNVNISNVTKSHIIDFFEEYSNVVSFIEITDMEIKKALKNINSYKPILGCFDIEFQTTILNNPDFITFQNFADEYVAQFPRELGMMMFITDKMNWFYIGHVFINFPSLTEYGFKDNGLRLLKSTYCSVTNKTRSEMEQVESVFNIDSLVNQLLDKNVFHNPELFKAKLQYVQDLIANNKIFIRFLQDVNLLDFLGTFQYINEYRILEREIAYVKKKLARVQFEIYGKYLSKEYYQQFEDLLDLYWNDQQVQDRIVKNDKQFLKLFTDLSNDVLFLVKGKQDFIALRNMIRLVFGSKERANFENTYDIETFNGLSNNFFGNSQLETTYDGLKDIIKKTDYNNISRFMDIIGGAITIKAHNPVTDSYYTIMVGIIVNVILNRSIANLIQ